LRQVRLLVQASFQPRLSLIAGTLVLGLPDITYFIFILTVVSRGHADQDLMAEADAVVPGIFAGLLNS